MYKYVCKEAQFGQLLGNILTNQLDRFVSEANRTTPISREKSNQTKHIEISLVQFKRIDLGLIETSASKKTNETCSVKESSQTHKNKPIKIYLYQLILYRSKVECLTLNLIMKP